MSPQSIEFAYRFCPACGVKNGEVGSIPFRCHSCQHSCFFGPVAAVGGLVIDSQNRLLLVRRARDPGKGKLGLPGGFVDRDETIEEALAREIVEETGLRVSTCKYLISYPNTYEYAGVRAPVIDLFYVCETSSTDQIKLQPTEIEAYLWTRPAREHLEQMAFPSNRRAIEYWLSTSK